jgi:AcrR family transcriptional regulator
MPAAVSTRQRLARAAFALFEEHGYDATSVDDIAARAKVGRTTLFRHFGSKEAIVFPDHDSLLQSAHSHLAGTDPEMMPSAVIDVARSVFDSYLTEGELAQARYRLTRTVPALRDYEVATVSKYVRLFNRHLQPTTNDSTAQLRHEIFAHAVVAAHNHVLRRWLRGDITDAHQEFSDAMATARTVLQNATDTTTSAVVILSTNQPLDSIVPRLRDAIGDLGSAL